MTKQSFFKTVALSLVASAMLVGCGSGGGSSAPTTNSSTTKTAYFVDSAVAGIDYITSSGKTGTTDANGGFEYYSTDTNVTFSIGKLTLPSFHLASLNNDSKILPTDLVGVDRNNTADANVTKLLQVLQSLDEDDNASNGITITQTVKNNFTTDANISDTNISTLETFITNAGKQLKSEQEAREHFESTLNDNFSYDVDTVAPSLPTFTNELNQTTTTQTQIELNGEVGAKIFLGSVDTNQTIGTNGKATLTLDTNTLGENNFTIYLQDSKGNKNSGKSFTLLKLNNTPSFTSSATASVNENQTTAITLTATDADGDTLTYSINGGDSASFDINSSTGVVTFKNAPDFETKSSYTFTASVSDGTATDTQSVTISINNILDNVPVIQGATVTVDENATSNTIVTTVQKNGTNSEQNTTTSFTIVSGDDGKFSIDSNGVIKVSSATLDYETKQSYTLVVKATNSIGDSATVNVVVNLNNVNDNTPSFTSSATASVNENQTTAITLTATDADGDTLTYSINGGDSASFDINSSTGVVTFKVAPDFETKSSYTFTASVSDGTATDTQSVTISINNILDNVPVIQGATVSVDENATLNTIVTTVQKNGTNSDQNTTTSFTIVSGDDGKFSIDSNGVIKVSSATLDYETKQSYTLVVKATNSIGDSATVNVVVNLNNVNDNTPSFTSSATASVNENQTTAITLTATDADGDTLTYSINGGDSASFDINSSTGVVTFKNAPDFETKSSYTFTASVSDGTATDTQSVTISINNILDNVPVIQGATVSVDENATSNTIVTTVQKNGTNSDQNTTTSFTIVSGDDGKFSIDSNGVIKVSSATLDYETKQSYTLVVKATNSIGDSATVNVVVNLNNVNDTPIATFSSFATNEDTAYNGILTGSDSDGDTLTYSKVSDPSHGTVTVDTNGTFTYTPSANYYGTDSFSYKVNDGTIDSATKSVTITLSAVNDTPTINTTFADISLQENNGTTNYEINVSDVEGASLMLSVESNDTSILTVTQNWTNNLLQADYSGQTLDFNLTTVQDAYGIVKITIIVKDEDKNTTASFYVNVTETIVIFQSGETWKGLVYNTVKSPDTNRTWLDRNLGAEQACTSAIDSYCYGDYYQWGRNADGHQESNSPTTTTLADDINNVGTEFKVNFGDWTSADSNGSLRSANWSKTNGSSVCPAGYRVPTMDEIKAETTQVTNSTTAFNSFLKLPMAGYRGNDGRLEFQTTRGYLWSSSTYDNSNSRYFYFTNKYAFVDNYIRRAEGMSVRCIKAE